VSQTRIKICGIARAQDALVAASSGADAIGLVFYPASSRAVTAQQAAEIVAVLPPFVTTVGLFVNEPADQIERILNEVSLDVLQFHGDETAAFCQQFARPWIKALRVRADTDIAAACREFSAARGLLLDAWQQGVPGGTGKTFDWQLASASLPAEIILAGGLHAENVANAIDVVRPAAVDVSGGVEASPGVKDAGKIRSFIAAVRAADRELEG
jgi:phosphoribosylanthranilate isomerase